MATTIKLKNSVTTTNAPSSLEQGEVAVNVTDKKVWVGNAATSPVQLLGDGADGTFSTVTVTGNALLATTSGNVGVGVTPSAWYTVYGTKAIQVSGSGALYGLDVSSSDRRVGLFNNAFINSAGTNTYINTGAATQYQQVAGAHSWFNAPSGTAGNAITFTQAMTLNASGGLKTLNTIGVGNATPSTSGAGITFPATQSASTDANTLDDYEEGTWTPTVSGSTVAGTGTYTTQVGAYTKVGRLVTVTATVVWTAHTGTGNIRIPNLPFTSANITSSEYLCVPEFLNMTMPASTIPNAVIGPNSTIMTIYTQAVGTGELTALAMDTAANIYLSITYQAT